MNPMTPLFVIAQGAGVVGDVKRPREEPLPGTNGQTTVPERNTVVVELRVGGKNTRWPPFFADRFGRWHFYAKDLAEEITNAGLTGIEFLPVDLTFGKLRKLQGSESSCPGYVCARVNGLVHADVYCQQRRLEADETGMYLVERIPSGYTGKYKLHEAQPQMLDFNRIVPGNRGVIVVSETAARFFEGRFDPLSECLISPIRNNLV